MLRRFSWRVLSDLKDHEDLNVFETHSIHMTHVKLGIQISTIPLSTFETLTSVVKFCCTVVLGTLPTRACVLSLFLREELLQGVCKLLTTSRHR